MYQPTNIPAFPIVLCRATIGHADGIDITVRSAVGHNRDFAPTWEMVRGHQTRTMNNREYTRRYLAILEALPIQAWRKLTAQAKNNTLVFLCYCLDETTDGARKFCHTHIICDYLLNRWPQFFRDGRK